MTRGEALKDFFRKTILPVVSAALLYCIFRSACVKNGELDYLWLWILCGLPFGIWRLRLWIIPGGRSFGGSIALFAFNFLLLLLFSFHPNINGRNDEGPFTAGQSIKGGRCQMKFVKAIVSNVGFTITFTD